MDAFNIIVHLFAFAAFIVLVVMWAQVRNRQQDVLRFVRLAAHPEAVMIVSMRRWLSILAQLGSCNVSVQGPDRLLFKMEARLWLEILWTWKPKHLHLVNLKVEGSSEAVEWCLQVHCSPVGSGKDDEQLIERALKSKVQVEIVGC